MNKEKILSIVKTINLIAVAGFGILFLLGIGFVIEGLFYSRIFQIMILGYILALVFGILAYRKNVFLLGCLLGWLIFGGANIIDAKKVADENCAKQGENIGAQGMPKSCCKGLSPMGGWPGNYTGDCSIPPPPTGILICSNCGDSICDKQDGENKCNCPDDCR